MISRLLLVKNHLSSEKPEKKTAQAQSNKVQNSIISSSLSYFNLDDLLTEEERKFRILCRSFLEREIEPYLPQYVEKAEFPYELVRKMGGEQWMKKFLRKPYGDDVSHMTYGLTLMEMARVDAGLSTLLIVQMGLAGYTLELFASDEQKRKIYDDMIKFKYLVGWGLTEEQNGSDASNLQSTVKKVPGGFRLNGNKRWIGNSNGDMVIVWARDEDTNQIGAYMVPTNTPGVQVEIIKNKLALRIVMNGQLRFQNAFIPTENQLPGANKGFGSVNQVLEHSRLFVAWLALGIAIGVYDHVIKYINDRQQFGKKITAFQLSQEKLSRMMGHIHGMTMLVWRVTRLYEDGKATIGRMAMAKAWITKQCREVCQLGRELMGGNGIIHDYYAMKGLADIEAVYTYEGTYDINMLVCGRELTGIPAFK